MLYIRFPALQTIADARIVTLNKQQINYRVIFYYPLLVKQFVESASLS